MTACIETRSGGRAAVLSFRDDGNYEVNRIVIGDADPTPYLEGATLADYTPPTVEE